MKGVQEACLKVGLGCMPKAQSWGVGAGGEVLYIVTMTALAG